MPILVDIRELITGEVEQQTPLRLKRIQHAAIVFQDGIIQWVGKQSEVPKSYWDETAISAENSLVVPGLIDCHTHLAFGGWRADEFEEKLKGASYLDIAKKGGGIRSTVKNTRESSLFDLQERCLSFLDEMAKLGITTIEAKSGYGLSLEHEVRTLRLYRELDFIHPIDIVSTCLAAHTIPEEFKDHREGYIQLVMEEILPAVAAEELAEFCDIFTEETAFTQEETRRILNKARELGMKTKLHADQITSGGGAALAAELGATSADHLEMISSNGIHALKASGTVAVSLPIATLYLNQRPLPARELLNAGVPVAVATDFNPGSAPSYHLPLAMMLACTLQRMTPDEVLAGVTSVAAQAIDAEDMVGSILPGKLADFAVIDADSLAHWMYHFRPNACLRTFKRGALIYAS